MKTRLVLAAVAVLVIAGFAASVPGRDDRAAAASLAERGGPITYSDSATDSPGTLGIVSTTISNSGSQISVTINYNGRGALKTGDAIDFFVHLGGASAYAVEAYASGVTMYRYAGSSYAPDASAITNASVTPQSETSGAFAFTLTSVAMTSPRLASSTFDFLVKTWVDGKTAAAEASDWLPDKAANGNEQAYTYAGDFPAAPDPATLDDDNDGIPNGQDACPQVYAGDFDPNYNGCPGPYPQIRALLIVPSAPTKNYVLLQSFTMWGVPKSKPTQGLPPGTAFKCRAYGKPCRWFPPWVIKTGYDKRYWTTPVRAAAPYSFSLTLTKAHYIGRVWNLRVARAGSLTKLFVSTPRCIVPDDPTNFVPCASIDRGS